MANPTQPSAKLALAAFITTLLVGAAAATGTYIWANNNAYAAKVNGEVISSGEYLNIVERAKKQYAGQIGMDFNSESGRSMLINLKENVMNSLVDMALMKQKAQEFGLTVSPDEKESRFNEFLRSRYQGNESALEEALKENRVTRAEFDKQFEDQILLQKLYQKVIEEVKVNESDIEAFYKENLERFSVAEQIAAQHILLKADPDNQAEVETVRKKAEGLIVQLKSGAAFDTLAKTHSEDEGSKASGGDLGSFAKGQMVLAFEEAAWKLQPGEITPNPVKTNFGWHIIKRGATTPGSVRPLSEVRSALEEQLKQNKQQEAFEAWLKKSKEAANIKVNEKIMAVPELKAAPSGAPGEASGDPPAETSADTAPVPVPENTDSQKHDH